MTARNIAEAMLIAAVDSLKGGETAISVSAQITTSIEGDNELHQQVSINFRVDVEHYLDLDLGFGNEVVGDKADGDEADGDEAAA